MEFHELDPQVQQKVRAAHPEFDSYPDRKKDLAIKVASKNVRVAKGNTSRNISNETAAVNENLNLDANPLGYHKSLYKSNEALDKIANDHPNQDAMRSVFQHTDMARSSLAAHWDAHHAGNVEEAAGHLKAAADHISNAAVAYHIVSGIPGGTEEIKQHVKNIANGYKYNVAGGKAPQVKQAKPSMELTNLANQREADAAAQDKQWEKESRKSDKKLPPEIKRRTPEEKDAAIKESLSKRREMGAAPDWFNQRQAKMSPGTTSGGSSSSKVVGEGAKYLGSFAEFGPHGTPVVPKINREIFKVHAQDAIEALRSGKKIPDETKRALGSAGVTAVYKSERNRSFQEGQEK